MNKRSLEKNEALSKLQECKRKGMSFYEALLSVFRNDFESLIKDFFYEKSYTDEDIDFLLSNDALFTIWQKFQNQPTSEEIEIWDRKLLQFMKERSNEMPESSRFSQEFQKYYDEKKHQINVSYKHNWQMWLHYRFHLELSTNAHHKIFTEPLIKLSIYEAAFSLPKWQNNSPIIIPTPLGCAILRENVDCVLADKANLTPVYYLKKEILHNDWSLPMKQSLIISDSRIETESVFFPNWKPSKKLHDKIICLTSKHKELSMGIFRNSYQDHLDAFAEIREEIQAIAKNQKFDLDCDIYEDCFSKEQRSIRFWHQNNLLNYQISGKIKVLPKKFKNSGNVWTGFWNEHGYLETMEQAFELLKSWLFCRDEVEELSCRIVRSQGIS